MPHETNNSHHPTPSLRLLFTKSYQHLLEVVKKHTKAFVHRRQKKVTTWLLLGKLCLALGTVVRAYGQTIIIDLKPNCNSIYFFRVLVPAALKAFLCFGSLLQDNTFSSTCVCKLVYVNSAISLLKFSKIVGTWCDGQKTCKCELWRVDHESHCNFVFAGQCWTKDS